MNTTIAISKDVRDKIREFGIKGESYSEILLKLYDSAKKRQLQDLLMNSEGTVSVEKSLERAKKRWSK